MITDEPDWRFKQRLDMLEMAWPRLLADPHYGPLMHWTGRVHLLDEFRQEWREREERARARRLRWEASVGEG